MSDNKIRLLFVLYINSLKTITYNQSFNELFTNQSTNSKQREFKMIITNDNRDTHNALNPELQFFKNFMLILDTFFSNRNYVSIIYDKLHEAIDILGTLMLVPNNDSSLDVKLVIMKTLISLLKSISPEDLNVDDMKSTKDNDSDIEDIDEDLNLVKKTSLNDSTKSPIKLSNTHDITKT